jgi:hypothetical protein
MREFNRRTFLGMSIGGLSLLHSPAAFAQATCVTGGLPPFLPVRLSVDCASRRNFQLFRKNQAYLGLTGVVSMSFVRGKFGTYQAGNLFLFPWLKPKGQALGAGVNWGAVFPTSATAVAAATPINGAALPQDEYFCRVTLQAPYKTFIGFLVDVAYNKDEVKRPWFSNVPKLPGGQTVGIDWTSQNMNRTWFGGSQWIPADDQCNGGAWRKLIAEGINQAAVGAC